MTKVNFISRLEATKLIESGLPEKTVLISISDTNQEREEIINLCDGNINIFTTVFKDIDTQESGFTVELAKGMQEFIDQAIANKMDIVVHCLAGVSRSGAIAKWINDYYGLNDWYLNEYKGHNRYVYEVMNEAAGCSLAAWYRDMEGKE